MRFLLLVAVIADCCGLLAVASAGDTAPPPGAISRFCVELPNLQCPASLIIDDPTPIFARRLSAEELAQRKAAGKGVDMWTFFDDLVNLFCEFQLKGKFTVNSYVGGVGMIDMLTKPEHKQQLEEFVSIVRKRLVPNFDITPEIISHGTVINVETGQPLGVKDPEHIWSQTQDEDTLERYIARGLVALKNVGLTANGVTSPCDFGSRNEANYVRAISRAMKRVHGTKFTWYFLQTDSADYIEPRLMYLDRQAGEAVVNIMPTNLTCDIGLRKRFGRDVAKTVDVQITADGRGGALPRLIASRSYLVFYKHWGIFCDGGQETGIKVLREVLMRLRRHYPGDLQWMTCSDVARYYAAAKTYRMTQRGGSGSVAVQLESPFACPCFTVSFTTPRKVKKISVDGKELKPAAGNCKRLQTLSWAKKAETVYASFPLGPTTQMTVWLGE